MNFKSAKCPNCAGELQLPDDAKQAKCMYCGSDITVQEAIEKYQIEVSGSVKFDKTSELQNYFKLASTAMESDNPKRAYEYASKILEIEPDNYKAWLILAKAAAWNSTYSQPNFEEAKYNIIKAYDIFKGENLDKDKLKEEFYNMLVSVGNAVFSYMNLCFENTKSNPQAVRLYDEKMELAFSGLWAVLFFINVLEKEENIFDIDAVKKILETLSSIEIRNLGNVTERRNKGISAFTDIIKRVDNSFDSYKYVQQATNNTKACYIATAVYGDYNAPEVYALRQFRDNVLEKSFWGRLFIKIYYFISPPIANRLKHMHSINDLVKRILDKWVHKLNS